MRVRRYLALATLLGLLLSVCWAQRQPQPMFTPVGPVWQPPPPPVQPPPPPPPQWAPPAHTTTSPPATAPPQRASVTQQIVALMNEERAKGGLRALTNDAQLQGAAQGHSDEMARTKNFSHTGSRPGRGQPADRVEAEGYSWARVAENIFMAQGKSDQQLASSCVQAWMNSPGHRRNIMDRDVKNVGVAIGRNGQGEVYVTAVYAARM